MFDDKISNHITPHLIVIKLITWRGAWVVGRQVINPKLQVSPIRCQVSLAGLTDKPAV